MRSLFIAAMALALAACTTASEQASKEAEGHAKLQQLLAGKTPGKPQSCLSTFRSDDMIRVSDNTVLFRDGSRRIYRNDVIGSCNGLGSPHYTLVTNRFGGSSELCAGDLTRIVDMSTGMFVGSCALGQFVPYTAPQG